MEGGDLDADKHCSINAFTDQAKFTGLRLVKKRTIFALVLALIVMAIVETALHTLCFISPRISRILSPPTDERDNEKPSVYPARIVEDEILELRPSPSYGDHDTRGYRNEVALNKADIVCLGDSQTYGVGVDRDDTWPCQLSKISGKATYSISCDGWGPTHSEAVLDEACTLQPNLVVEALYSGNDLYDCYRMVYERKKMPQYLMTDESIKRNIDVANQSEPLTSKIRPLGVFSASCFGANGPKARGDVRPPNVTEPSLIRRVLSRYSRTFGMARAIKNRLLRADDGLINEQEWPQLVKAAQSSHGLWEALESKQVRHNFPPPVSPMRSRHARPSNLRGPQDRFRISSGDQ